MKKRSFGSLKPSQQLAHRRHRLTYQMKGIYHKKKRKIILLRVRLRKLMLGVIKKMEKVESRERQVRETKKS